MIIPAEALGWDPEVPFLGYIVRLVRPAIRAQEYYGFSCLFSVRVLSPVLTDLELGKGGKRRKNVYKAPPYSPSKALLYPFKLSNQHSTFKPRNQKKFPQKENTLHPRESSSKDSFRVKIPLSLHYFIP